MRTPVDRLFSSFIALATVMASGLVLGACASTPTPVPTPIAPPSESRDTGSNGLAPPAITGVTWPFTGLPADDPNALTRAAVAVKVDNAPGARPQTGLDQADVVIEEIVEGGTTRFLAIYQSSLPEEVAPVRSGRPVDTQILPSFGADLAMSGAAEPTLQVLRAGGLNLWIHGEVDGAFWRVKGRKAPHNLAVNVAKVAEQVAGQGRTATQSPFLFDATPPQPDVIPGTSPATRADVSFSDSTKATWTWAQDHWARTQQGEQPWKAATVVIAQVTVAKDGGRDSGGNATVHTELTGSGPAVILRNGMAIEGSWRKNSPSAPLSVVDQAGAPVFFAPGQTWIELAPSPPKLNG